jgi:hypothetical protein
MTKRKGVWGLNQVRMKRVDDIWEQSTWNYGIGESGKGQLGEPGCGNPYGRAARIMTYPAPFDYAGSGTKWKKLASGTDTYTISIWDQDDNMYIYGNNRYTGVLGMNNSNGGGYEGPGAMICTPTLFPAGSGRTWAHAHYADGQCYAVKDNGELWAWGSNERGALGLNSLSVEMYSSPVQVGTDTTWSSAYGSIKTCGSGYDSRAVYALKTNGTLWAWGHNDSVGWLGVNDKNQRSSPTQIGGTTWSHIAEGGRGAIKTDGTLWLWGRGTMGQLGLNQGNNQGGNPGGDYSSPKQVGTATNWHRIYRNTNGNNSVAVKTDGTLWVWGWNANGALGLNTQGTGAPYYGTQYPGSRSSPTQLGMSSDWVLVGGGTVGNGGRAGNSKGEIWSWGSQGGNSSFGLSYNDSTQYSSPVMAAGTGSEFIFSNEDNTFAGTYGSWNGFVNKIPATDL